MLGEVLRLEGRLLWAVESGVSAVDLIRESRIKHMSTDKFREFAVNIFPSQLYPNLGAEPAVINLSRGVIGIRSEAWPEGLLQYLEVHNSWELFGCYEAIGDEEIELSREGIARLKRVKFEAHKKARIKEYLYAYCREDLDRLHNYYKIFLPKYLEFGSNVNGLRGAVEDELRRNEVLYKQLVETKVKLPK